MATNFHVGDKITIIDKELDPEKNPFRWTDDMDELIGNTYTVQSVRSQSGVRGYLVSTGSRRFIVPGSVVTETLPLCEEEEEEGNLIIVKGDPYALWGFAEWLESKEDFYNDAHLDELEEKPILFINFETENIFIPSWMSSDYSYDYHLPEDWNDLKEVFREEIRGHRLQVSGDNFKISCVEVSKSLIKELYELLNNDNLNLDIIVDNLSANEEIEKLRNKV